MAIDEPQEVAIEISVDRMPSPGEQGPHQDEGQRERREAMRREQVPTRHGRPAREGDHRGQAPVGLHQPD
ncbi:hypothetical protein D3C86_1991520 [compost metagenome]